MHIRSAVESRSTLGADLSRPFSSDPATPSPGFVKGHRRALRSAVTGLWEGSPPDRSATERLIRLVMEGRVQCLQNLQTTRRRCPSEFFLFAEICLSGSNFRHDIHRHRGRNRIQGGSRGHQTVALSHPRGIHQPKWRNTHILRFQRMVCLYSSSASSVLPDCLDPISPRFGKERMWSGTIRIPGKTGPPASDLHPKGQHSDSPGTKPPANRGGEQACGLSLPWV